MIENGISASEDKIVGKRFESFYWISIYNIYALLFNYSLFTLESNTLTHLWICCDIWGWITGNCLICLWKISFPLFEQTPLLTAIEIRTKWRIDKFMVFLIPLTSSSVSLPSYLLLELFVCFRYRPWCEFGHECGLWIHWSVIAKRYRILREPSRLLKWNWFLPFIYPIISEQLYKSWNGHCFKFEKSYVFCDLSKWTLFKRRINHILLLPVWWIWLIAERSINSLKQLRLIGLSRASTHTPHSNSA